MENGKLIVFEGSCDGVGKSTQYLLLYKHLEADGLKVMHHHFPSYNTYHGEPVERYLKGEYGKAQELSPYFVNSLYATDRGITWYTKLKKMYEQGNVLLLDRYTTSSLIYQSALIEDINEKIKFIEYVSDFEYNKIGIKKPDNVIFLDVPFDLATKIRNGRKQNEGVKNDIHEQDLEFMKKVYESAIFLAQYLSWDKVKCNNGNKIRDIEDIHEEIYSLVRKRK